MPHDETANKDARTKMYAFMRTAYSEFRKMENTFYGSAGRDEVFSELGPPASRLPVVAKNVMMIAIPISSTSPIMIVQSFVPATALRSSVPMLLSYDGSAMSITVHRWLMAARNLTDLIGRISRTADNFDQASDWS